MRSETISSIETQTTGRRPAKQTSTPYQPWVWTVLAIITAFTTYALAYGLTDPAGSFISLAVGLSATASFAVLSCISFWKRETNRSSPDGGAEEKQLRDELETLSGDLDRLELFLKQSLASDIDSSTYDKKIVEEQLDLCKQKILMLGNLLDPIRDDLIRIRAIEESSSNKEGVKAVFEKHAAGRVSTLQQAAQQFMKDIENHIIKFKQALDAKAF